MGQKDSDEMRFSRIRMMDMIHQTDVDQVYYVGYDEDICIIKVPQTGYRPSEADTIRPYIYELGVLGRTEYQKKAYEYVPDSTIRIVDAGIRPYGWTVSERADYTFENALTVGFANVSDIVCILDKLDALHRHGFCHDNINPHNILKVNGTWKFTDFIGSPVKNAVTMENDPSYWMFKAPEDLLKNGKTGCATDVWQMGILLYITVTGCSPYPKTYDMNMIMETIFMHGPDLAPVPDLFKSVLSKALAPKMDRRYQTAGQMADDLRKIGFSDNKNDRTEENDPSASATAPDPNSCTQGSKTPYREDLNHQGNRGMTPDSPAAEKEERNTHPDENKKDTSSDIPSEKMNSLSKEEKKKAKIIYDTAKSIHLLKTAANPNAYGKAPKPFSESAGPGNNGAPFDLEYMHMNGTRKRISYLKTRRYLSLAVSGNQEGTDDLIGQMKDDAISEIRQRMMSGCPTENDLAYLDQSGSEGNREADRFLGNIYENGIGTDVDMKKAIDHYGRGGIHGDIECLMTLANIHLTGKGTMMSYILAGECYEEAAKLGSVDAMRALGAMYAEHKLFCYDPGTRSREWYAKAKENESKGSGRRIGRRSEGKRSETGEKRSLFGLFRRKSR